MVASVPVSESLARSAAWQGRAELEFARDGDRTALTHARALAPLKIQRSHYPEGPEMCYATLVHTAGGMVGGDRLDQSIHLHPHSRVLLTTPAASKIYRSTGATSSQTVRICVDENAWLEWLPQDAIVFDGAKYAQQVRVDLDAGARILLWDIVRLGRSARGEQFMHGQWRSQIEVWRAGEPVWIDRQAIAGGTAMTFSPHALAGYPVLGTLALVGRTLTDEEMFGLRAAIASTPIPAHHVGLTRNLDGVVCRYRGPSSQLARQCFSAIWRQLRFIERGTMPDVPRVWL